MRPPETWLGNITKAAEIVKVALCQQHQRGGCGIEMSEPGGAGNTDRALTHRSVHTNRQGGLDVESSRAISKRLRFEILRRDNHQCRYCGRSAPEVALTIDHVVPVALGGSNEPSNLATACRDCNSGKSSMPADAPIVADVAADAIRWARAMEIVAHGRAVQRAENLAIQSEFLSIWTNWTYPYQGERKPFDLPLGWEDSIRQFIDAGLEIEDLDELVDVAMRCKTALDKWRYFCGCCWRRIDKSHEHARAIIAIQEADE